MCPPGGATEPAWRVLGLIQLDLGQAREPKSAEVRARWNHPRRGQQSWHS